MLKVLSTVFIISFSLFILQPILLEHFIEVDDVIEERLEELKEGKEGKSKLAVSNDLGYKDAWACGLQNLNKIGDFFVAKKGSCERVKPIALYIVYCSLKVFWY